MVFNIRESSGAPRPKRTIDQKRSPSSTLSRDARDRDAPLALPLANASLSGLCRVPCRTVLFRGLQSQKEHVKHNQEVDGDHQDSKPGGPPEQIGRLKRNVDGAGGKRQPLRPWADVPQSVGLDESKDYVDRCHGGDLPQAYVADSGHQGDKHPNVVVMRIDVKKFQ
jgi:hypothetical protein